ncbi:MAG: hypothetical protein Q6L50_07150 [Gloeomargarita sp. GMQP_bins_120]
MPYKTPNEYMSWGECCSRCPQGAIQRIGHHYCWDPRRCNRCRDLGEYRCGGIFEDNSPDQLEDISSYWRQWFATYQQHLARLQTQQGVGGRP